MLEYGTSGHLRKGVGTIGLLCRNLELRPPGISLLCCCFSPTADQLPPSRKGPLRDLDRTFLGSCHQREQYQGAHWPTLARCPSLANLWVGSQSTLLGSARVRWSFLYQMVCRSLEKKGNGVSRHPTQGLQQQGSGSSGTAENLLSEGLIGCQMPQSKSHCPPV